MYFGIWYFRCVLASLLEGVSVHRSVSLLVRPSIGPSVGPSVSHTQVDTMQMCRFWPKLLSVRARTHLMPCIRPCFCHSKLEIRLLVILLISIKTIEWQLQVLAWPASPNQGETTWFRHMSKIEGPTSRAELCLFWVIPLQKERTRMLLYRRHTSVFFLHYHSRSDPLESIFFFLQFLRANIFGSPTLCFCHWRPTFRR